MATFPLPFKPKLSYHEGGRRFGANRDGSKRKHAACDLIAAKGTEIYAVENGQVAYGPYLFYRGTYAIEFRLDSGKVVRYCEIEKVATGVAVGSKLTEGTLIAYVGKMYVDSMLHFELYVNRVRSINGSIQSALPTPLRFDQPDRLSRRMHTAGGNTLNEPLL